MSIPGYDAWIFHHPADDRCPDCDGWRNHDCMNCGGEGELADGVECPECEGTGTVDCETCTGDPGDDDYAFDRYRDDLMKERLK